MMGVRVIGQLHDPDVNREYELSSEARRTFIRWTFRLPDAWIVLGDVWEKFMLQAGVPKPIICIIPNAVKKEFASLAKSHIAPQESFPPVILFTGTVGYRKGIDLLLDALEALQAENATELAFKAELVGNGELQGEREALIEEFTKRLRPGSFEFVSHQEQQALIDRFIHASIFVLPSRAENLPIAMLEAMACALPVVVSRVGAVDEVIQDGKNGLLVGRERPTELKIALSTLLRFPDLRKRLGYNAQQTILRNHLSAEVGKKMDAFINYLEERL
jgi:glycosyltransferase involved in cell wall biosynthesis